MNKTFNRLRWIFLGVFVVATAAVWTYQLGWVLPRQRCERAHRWWSDRYRACAIPVSVSTFTGRPDPVKLAPAPRAAPGR